MKKKFWKYSLLLLIIVMMTAIAGRSVRAEEEGSMILRLPADGAGIKMTLYQIAECGSDGSYNYTEEFALCPVGDLNLDSTEAAQAAAVEFAGYAEEQEIEGVPGEFGPEGILEFTDLQLGIYLVAQTEGRELLEVPPLLVPLPWFDAAAAEMSCRADISPKYSFPGGAVIVTKIDDTGKTLKDAQFLLQKKTSLSDGESAPEGASAEMDEAGSFYWKELSASFMTSESGQIVVTGLEKGEYRFVEKQAPAGCVLSVQAVPFSVTGAGTVKEIDGVYYADAGKVEAVSIVNERTSLKIQKVDGMGNVLAGAELVLKDGAGEIIRNEDGTPRYSFTTAEEPYILRGLPAGDYYLSELSAPHGYQLADDVKFTLDASDGAINEVTMVDEPTPTEAASPTPTETASPTPTETASPTPTETASPTPTEAASPTPTETLSPTPTETLSPTPTETASPTPTEAASPTPTETASPTPTETASPTPTEAASPTPTEAASPTPTEAASPTPTEAASPTPTETASPTPIETLSPTPTETLSPTPTETASPTPTETLSPTPIETVSPTPTETLSPTPTEAASPTPTETLSPTPIETASPTPTETLSPMPTAAETPEPEPTETPAPDSAVSETPVPSTSVSVTPVPGGSDSSTPPHQGGSSPNVYDGSTAKAPAKTGDDTPILLYVMSLLISASVLKACLRRIQKTKER